MMNIKFIKGMTKSVNLDRKIFGDCVYFDLHNGKVAKCFCNPNDVEIHIISKVNGMVDNIKLPFANYFTQKQCSSGAPKWDQYITNDNKWYFDTYPWCLPTEQDYNNITQAIKEYIIMFKEV